MTNEKCVNCGISHVPLYTGLDGRMHCSDHIGLLVGAFLSVENASAHEKYDKQAKNYGNTKNCTEEEA